MRINLNDPSLSDRSAEAGYTYVVPHNENLVPGESYYFSFTACNSVCNDYNLGGDVRKEIPTR